METIRSVSEFVAAILRRPSSTSNISTFRGHGSEAYQLQPSIFRSNATRENEDLLLRELIAAHPEDFTGDATALEMLVRMQHYSLPTRLLDVTMNPLVSLYFACESAKKRVPTTLAGRRITKLVEDNGQVLVLSVPRRRMRYFDSDTVSCLANLARLSFRYKTQLDTNLEKDAFNNSTAAKRLLHFIRQEKYGFLSEIEPFDLEDIILVKPKQNNKRILAQSGAFFVFGVADEIKDNNGDGINVERINVDAASKSDIRAQLDKLGINEKTLFPEIERAARYITGTLSTGGALSKVIR